MLNSKHGARRVLAGKQAVIVDSSMREVRDIDPAVTGEEAVVQGNSKDQPRVGDKAFDDETDLQNEDFIFVY